MNRNKLMEHALVWNLGCHAVEGSIIILVELWGRFEDLDTLSDRVHKVGPRGGVGLSDG